MSEPPLVSIIVPCHNAAAWLAETLESALAQQHAPLEIIFIDDGSNDQSLGIARTFEQRGVKIATQANRGAAAARNHGLRLARGSYIQFLDADDLLTADKIAAQISLLEADSTRRAIATCRWGRFATTPAATKFVDTAVFRDFEPMEYLVGHTSAQLMMHPAAWLLPRSVADAAGQWNEDLSLNDDGEYFARAVLVSSKIIFSAHGASLYRSGIQTSLSRRRSRQALESVFRSVALISHHIESRENTPRIRAALADYWQRLAYELYPAATDLSRKAERRSTEYGRSTLRPHFGTKQRWLAKVIGWRLTRRIAVLSGRAM